MTIHSRVLSLFGALLVAGGVLLAQATQPTPRAPSPAGTVPTGDLRFRYLGPVGNRVTSVAGIPGNPWTYYAGAASGGIWKTVDAGIHWEPIFDDQDVSSIGSLAIAPSDSSIIWAGTGEAHIRSHISVGAGIFKSTDAGRSWTLMGLEKTGRIGRIQIDPRNPDVVLACALGHAYGPQPDRGVYRTLDGGKNWERVLFVDENTGCSEVQMDPSSSRTIYAGMWTLEIKTWGRTSGGPGSGIYKSTDAGTTWRKLTGHGLPSQPVGKVALAIARSNPDRVYALIETADGLDTNNRTGDRGELWRSDDGGENWQVVSYDRQLAGRTHYYSRVAVHPDNQNDVHFLSAAYSHSLDGGQSLEGAGRGGGFGGASPGGDNHDIWIDPTTPERMIVANDAGISISVTRGRTWQRVQLPIAQMYHVTVDNQVPYFLYGNRQDGSSYRVPSNSLAGEGGRGGNISRSTWHPIGGGESGFATPDPVDPNIVWSSGTGLGSEGGFVERFDERNHQTRTVEVWPEEAVGASAAEVKYRFNWEFPITISPHDHNRVYVASQHVHVTTDGGQSWQLLSPDLTRNDRSKMGPSGGLTGDNIGVEFAGVVFAVAESPKERGVIWAGTNDGYVQLTRDNGKTWTNVTANISGMPEWGTVSNIEASRHDAGTAYIAVDAHQMNNRDPFVFKTNDYGKTWKLIVNGVPKSMFSYAHCVREDPVRKGLLYLGTENGLYVSFNDGENWQPLQSNLPRAPVYWLAIQDKFNDLAVATYGRGFWIMDDITPLQQLAAEVQGANAHLFTPRTSYRFRGQEQPAAASDDQVAGQNPPYGASINYWLKSPPQGEVRITILDASGRTVRTLRGNRNVGINRVMWDLRGEPTPEIRLRTSPPGAPDVRPGAEGWRPIPGGRRVSILEPPGTYTVKLNAGGQEFTEKLQVLKDPVSSGSEADITQQIKFLNAVTADLGNAAESINQIELIRSQLANLATVVDASQSASAAATVKKQATDLDAKLAAVEEKLFQIRVTGRGQDQFRWAPQIVEKLTHLAGNVASSDFPPTKQDVEVQQLLNSQLSGTREKLGQTLRQDLADFNNTLKQMNLPTIVFGGRTSS